MTNGIFALTGKTAVITGGGGILGSVMAEALAERGVAVAILDVREEAALAVAGIVAASGGRAIGLPCDVLDEASLARAAERVLGDLGGLDILVNAAGMTQTGKVENADLADWRYVFELNFWAGFYTSRAAIPALKAGGGDIVNISSTAGRRAVGATFGPYAASKFALTAFNESLRAEVTLAGIRVCIIEPGATATEIHEHIKDEKVREFTRNHVEKDGAMRPEDVAAAIVFVVSLPPRVNVSQLVIRPSVDTRVL